MAGFFGCFYLDPNTSEQKQACKKHELYVSFRDLGWQVRGRVWKCQEKQKDNSYSLQGGFFPRFFTPLFLSLPLRLSLSLTPLLCQGLDNCTRGLCSILLWRRMLISTQCTYECNKSCNCPDIGKCALTYYWVKTWQLHNNKTNTSATYSSGEKLETTAINFKIRISDNHSM